MTMLVVRKVCVYPAALFVCYITPILAEVWPRLRRLLSLRLPLPRKIRLWNGSLPPQSLPNTTTPHFSQEEKEWKKEQLLVCWTFLLHHSRHSATPCWCHVTIHAFIPGKEVFRESLRLRTSSPVYSRAGSPLTSCWQDLLLHRLQIQRNENWTFYSFL